MCGIVGMAGRTKAAVSVSRGLYALQHRGHDSCGIAFIAKESGNLDVINGKGAVADVLPNNVTENLNTSICLGQNLYTTFGNAHSPQPFGGRFWDEKGAIHQLAVAHNGQLCGIDKLRSQFPVVYRTHSDSEIIFSMLPHMHGSSLGDKLTELLKQLDGAFSLLFLLDDKLIAARDHHGFRPLIMGKFPDGGICFASENNAFDLMGAEFVRQVKPGEMIVADTHGNFTSTQFKAPAAKLSQCVFEHIYFARPDNQLFGKPGYSTQKALGEEAARELKGKISADLVIALPDSANIPSLGFAQTIGMPFEVGLLRHHYAARTFITRGQKNREEAVHLKFNVVKDTIKGKRIILGDDSLVRSTTSKIVIKMLRKGGAKEIHLVLFSPPITHPCIYGINMASENELLASRFHSDTDLIAKEIGADSVHYLSMEGLRRVMGKEKNDYCYACMDGCYPIAKNSSELFES